MTRSTTLLALLVVHVLFSALPVAADSRPAKELCQGTEYTATYTSEDGKRLSETIYLDWRMLFSTESILDAFRNQGQCIAHVNHDGVLYFQPCAHLKGDEIRQAALCYTRAWILSPAGQ